VYSIYERRGREHEVGYDKRRSASQRSIRSAPDSVLVWRGAHKMPISRAVVVVSGYIRCRRRHSVRVL
jgi:hypothetical protein